MKYSLAWINELTPITQDIDTLCSMLTSAGFEVEGKQSIGAKLQNIVTGKIIDIQKHPDADKLQITQIDIGKNNPQQIVTGAQNIFVGAIVPVSLPGAVLANGTEIKNGVLRGIESSGMLCSQTELGLAEESQGIWILPKETPIGIDLVDYAKIKDTLIEINILPNRGDCMSMLGIAREIAALTGQPLTLPKSHDLNALQNNPEFITNEIPEKCAHYCAANIEIKEIPQTPLWMQIRLLNCGITPLSLPVDITNYVMLEIGQPMHAFDATQINDSITIRESKDNEHLLALDNTTYILPEKSILIANHAGPIAIAGIIGGQHSGITPTTQKIILEAAHFDAIAIRKTKSALTINTESASRFVKAVDPELAPIALSRALHLFANLTQLHINFISHTKTKTSPLFNKRTIPFEASKINSLLGTNWPEKEMETLLEKLSIPIQNNTALIPSWRQDLTEWPCLAEEIARCQSLDSIPTVLPKNFIPISATTKLSAATTYLEDLLISLGLTQLNTLPMISQQDLNATSIERNAVFEIQNPISSEQSLMRPSLLPGILSVIAYNNHHFSPLKNCFEIGKIFYKKDTKIIEETELCIVLSQPFYKESYTNTDKASNSLSFQDIKGLCEVILEKNKSVQIEFKKIDSPLLHPIQSAELLVTKKSVGHLGKLHPKLTKTYDLETLYVVQLNLTALLDTPQKRSKSTAFSKLPMTRRDIALLAPKTLTHQEIMTYLSKNKSKWVKNITLFDLFEDKIKLGEDKKSLAYSLYYQGDNDPILEQDINNAHQKLCMGITENLPVQLR